jgi:hypothetical protein
MPTDDQNFTVVYVIQIDNCKDKMIGNLGNQLLNVWRGRSSGLAVGCGEAQRTGFTRCCG